MSRVAIATRSPWPRLPLRVRRREFGDRLPRADVAPVERAANDRHVAGGGGLLHHRVVERDVGHRGEQRRVDLEHHRVAFGRERLRNRAHGVEHGGRVPRERLEDRGRREAEHPRVPHVVAGGEVFARRRERRLLDEAPCGERRWRRTRMRVAALDVAEAGLGMRRRDAERHQRSAARETRPRARPPLRTPPGRESDDRRAARAAPRRRRAAPATQSAASATAGRRVATEGFEQERRALGRSGAQSAVGILGVEVVVAVGDGDELGRRRAARARAPRSSRAAFRRRAAASTAWARFRATAATGACRRRRRGSRE